MAAYEIKEHKIARVTVTVEPAVFQDALNKAYTKTRGRYNVPGFRKGKAPRKVIENYYGVSVFYDDALDLCWGAAYDAAIKENGLEPVDQPKIVDFEKISPEDGVVYVAEVQLKPDVTLGQYMGVEVEKPSYPVKDEEIEAEIESEREKNARYIDVDRPVENGDSVKLDYAGTVDGVAFDGGTAEDQTLVIGSNTFIPGFEEQMVGMANGEEKDIEVTFPEDYHEASLAGKAAVFHVKVNQIQVKELPALDDEFAKDISEYDTLDELRAAKRKEAEERSAKSEKNALENRTVRAVAKKATVEIPECMINAELDYIINDMDYQLQMSGIRIQDYLKWMGSDMETLRSNYKEEAEDRVRNQLVLEAVSKAENVQCTEEDYEAIVAEYAERMNMSVEDFKSKYGEDDKEYLTDRKIQQKTVDLLVANAVLVDPKPAEEAPAEEKVAE